MTSITWSNQCVKYHELSDEEMDQARAEALAGILGDGSDRKLAVAGPGTGKTYTFGELLAQSDGPNLALTFLTSLALDLQDNLGDRAEVYSFHGFAHRLLRVMSVDGITQGMDYYPAFDEIGVQDLRVLGTDATKNEIQEHLMNLRVSWWRVRIETVQAARLVFRIDRLVVSTYGHLVSPLGRLIPLIVEWDPLLVLTYGPVRTRRDGNSPVPLGTNAGRSHTQGSLPLSQVEGFGEGSGELSVRVTNQNGAMIRSQTMTLRRARWTPIEKSIHTAIETTTPCQTSVSNPVRNPPSGSIRYERSKGSRRSRRHCMLADFGPNKAVERPHDIVVKGWTAMSVRIRTFGGRSGTAAGPGG